MATIVQSRDEETISLPVWLMQMLEVQEGDEVHAIMNGNTLQLTPLEKFLNLRGVWADDDGFSEAIQSLESDCIHLPRKRPPYPHSQPPPF